MPKAFILLSTPSDILISVMFGLIRSFDRYADVIGLLLSQFGQFDADALQVEAGNFFVQTFRQAVDTYFVRHCPQIHLGQDLLITKEGWPVAQPKFTKRPSANRKIELPVGNVYLSTCGLMLVCWMFG